MDNSSNTPQPAPQQPAPQQPAPQQPAPQAPIDAAKTIRNGWILFAVSVVVTLVGLYFGYALAASALIAALAGRMGLQAKSKPLAITALVFCGLVFLLFTFALFGN